MGYLRASDTISGQEARAYIKIDGHTEEMFYAKNFKATAEKSKTELKTLGKRGVQNKAIGWKGSGSMTIYYATTKFRDMMYDYIQKGKDLYFDILVVNEDPMSSLGKQSIVIKNVNLNSVILAQFDVDAEILEEDMEFTFDDVEIVNRFNEPKLG
ncbi:phage protein [Vallitalea longa]|uniref:Phage protein n=1 Tax=Vallitalea longa TaxID=2936439 RepID=A0A9W6DF75_9FIRM|nr:phage tail tube protein [Vallitalea longa]GKX29192.1 phage protein [Vallitalea longa]